MKYISRFQLDDKDVLKNGIQFQKWNPWTKIARQKTYMIVLQEASDILGYKIVH